MQVARLGRTGLKVTRVCLGTMTFGVQCDEAQSVAILDRAAEGGISFIDTADGYPLFGTPGTVGMTEEILGRWLRGKRQNFIVATKCFAAMGPNPWDRGTSRRHIMDAVEGSLRRLGTDFIDLYQLHMYDPEVPIDESLEAMDALVRSGKVRYIGCSNWPAFRLARAIGRSELNRWARFDCVQPRYMYWNDAAFESLEQLRGVADELGMSLPALSLAWVLAQPAVTAPIIGASRPEHLDAAFAALEAKLSDDVLQRLDEITRRHRMGDAPL
jgi:aryl-alcohol dehydrogenase-like predicted oxidoreductase